MKVPIVVCACVAVGVTASAVASAQVPTFRDVTGHEFGERVTLHHEMVRYLERLDVASPRVTVRVQGHSWEGRELMLAVVTSPENHARLEAIREASLALADPRRTDRAQANALIADQPVVVWFGGSIHGFELSGAEGALKLLERLATADDPFTARRVYGQGLAFTSAIDNQGGCSAQSLSGPENMLFFANGLLVADTANCRILWFGNAPKPNESSP